MEKKLISLVTPCYNEEGNVAMLYEQVKAIIEGQLNKYDYEHIFIDNASSDNTVEILKEIAKTQYPKIVFKPPTRRYLKSSMCFENKKCIFLVIKIYVYDFITLA